MRFSTSKNNRAFKMLQNIVQKLKNVRTRFCLERSKCFAFSWTLVYALEYLYFSTLHSFLSKWSQGEEVSFRPGPLLHGTTPHSCNQTLWINQTPCDMLHRFHRSMPQNKCDLIKTVCILSSSTTFNKSRQIITLLSWHSKASMKFMGVQP